MNAHCAYAYCLNRYVCYVQTTETMIIFNILSKKDAQNTLERLTGITWSEWKGIRDSYDRDQWIYEDDYIEDVLKNKNVTLPSFYELEFVFSHVTTSANGCIGIRKHGLITHACQNNETELCAFLHESGVTIDLSRCELHYFDKVFDVCYDRRPPEYMETEYAAWLVGRKLYYDYGICGFLSYGNTAYGGYVHRRPELLMNIDRLLKTDLADKWEDTHQPYEVIAHIGAKMIVCDGDEHCDDQRKEMDYLMKAYWCTFSDNENIVLLRSEVEVPPENIWDVHPFEAWK